jgi:hypothetical protein
LAHYRGKVVGRTPLRVVEIEPVDLGALVGGRRRISWFTHHQIAKVVVGVSGRTRMHVNVIETDRVEVVGLESRLFGYLA